MDAKMPKLPAYVFRRPNGSYRYKRNVPKKLREVVGKATLYRQLGESYAEAMRRLPKVHAEIEAGKVQILLVSPEAVVSGGTNCLPHPSKMPPIAFACIDEAHCISEWSHNFRPSYLRLCKIIREKLGVSTEPN